MNPTTLLGPLATGWEPPLPSIRLIANCGHTIWLSASSATLLGVMDTSCLGCDSNEPDATHEMAPYAVDDLASIGIHTTPDQLNKMIPLMLARERGKRR